MKTGQKTFGLLLTFRNSAESDEVFPCQARISRKLENCAVRYMQTQVQGQARVSRFLVVPVLLNDTVCVLSEKTKAFWPDNRAANTKSGKQAATNSKKIDVTN